MVYTKQIYLEIPPTSKIQLHTNVLSIITVYFIVLFYSADSKPLKSSSLVLTSISILSCSSVDV